MPLRRPKRELHNYRCRFHLISLIFLLIWSEIPGFSLGVVHYRRQLSAGHQFNTNHDQLMCTGTRGHCPSSAADHTTASLVQGNTLQETKAAAAGPGSKPPQCISKCGGCRPCSAVRVPVRPGTPNASEYYPEAWRCKCGGKLYMP